MAESTPLISVVDGGAAARCAGAVKLLEGALEEARSGNLSAVFLVLDSGHFLSVRYSPHLNKPELIGRLHMLMSEILSEEPL